MALYRLRTNKASLIVGDIVKVIMKGAQWRVECVDEGPRKGFKAYIQLDSKDVDLELIDGSDDDPAEGEAVAAALLPPHEGIVQATYATSHSAFSGTLATIGACPHAKGAQALPTSTQASTPEPARCALCDAVHPAVIEPHAQCAWELNPTGLIGLVPHKLSIPLSSCEGALNAARRLLDAAPAPGILVQLGEHTVRLMLTQGANWVATGMNRRAKGGKTESSSVSITEQPAITIEEIKAAKAHELSSEPLMLEFQRLLCVGRPDAGLQALKSVSNRNLKSFEDWSESPVYRKLLSYDLTLTHYAEATRGYGFTAPNGKQQHHVLALFSRHLLDTCSAELGISNYPKGNTPSSALKNVGHHDWVFFSIEPRMPGPVAPPHKAGSRFGGTCHALDFGGVSPFAVMSLGDLDTRNAKIGMSRLERLFPECGATIRTDRKVAKRRIHDPDSGAEVEIEVRNFDTMSEQLFCKGDIKQALAAAVSELAMRYGLDEDIILNATDASVYNTLINCLFVPQVMIPHAIVTGRSSVFSL